MLVLCSLGATAGVHAAGGDDAAPAALIAKILGTYETDDGSLGTDASGLQPIDGDGSDGGGDADGDRDPGDGGGRQDGPGRTPSTDAPSTPTPTPTPGDPTDPDATPAPEPTPAPDQPAPAPVDPADPMSPEYNPYTTQGDPAYITDAEKSAWLGREAVVRTCMADAGFEYLDWQWWLGGSPQPIGQSPDEAAVWSAALRGDGASNSGCRAQAQQAADEAEAAGTPLSAPVPPLPGAEVPTERENWLEFQSAVRSCMAEQGLEYRYWEYWNPAYDSTDGSAAMPQSLDDATRAAWNLAAFGDASPVGGAPNDGGGCWATGLGESGYRTFD